MKEGLEKGLTDYAKPPSVDVEKDEESYWTTGELFIVPCS